MEDKMTQEIMDMELTAERVKRIQDALLLQYCDQFGLEIVESGRKGQNAGDG